MRATTANLIEEFVTLDAIGQEVKREIPHTIYCDVGSVTRSEWAQAAQVGLNAQIVIKTPAVNYNDELTVDVEGKRYGVYRTYSDGEIIELYLERKAGK